MIAPLLHSTASSFRALFQTPRWVLVLLCEALLLWGALTPFYEATAAIGFRCNMLLLPFVASDPLYYLTFLLGFIALVADAPFLSDNQIFVLRRCGKLNWAVGKVLYVIALSAAYWLFLVVLCAAFLLPCGTLATDGWGTLVYTLVDTDAGGRHAMNFVLDARIANNYAPITATLSVLLLGTFVSTALGLLVMAVNLATRTRVGMAVAVFPALFDLLVDNALPYAFYHLSLASHGRLAIIDCAGSPLYPSMGEALAANGAAILLLAIVSVALACRTELTVRETL